MKYRIIKVNNFYYIQNKFLFFPWTLYIRNSGTNPRSFKTIEDAVRKIRETRRGKTEVVWTGKDGILHSSAYTVVDNGKPLTEGYMRKIEKGNNFESHRKPPLPRPRPKP